MGIDKLRIGVIGVGGCGRIARHLHKPNDRSVVIGGADINEEYLASFKKEYGEGAFVTTDYRELLERKDIDAILVTTPDFCHEEHAVAALNAGKHVYCEKPLQYRGVIIS